MPSRERMIPWAWATLLALVVITIYAWSIGACGPWDPWETHYGEVARNIVAREDPMDLWWRPGYGPHGKREGVFASKHALPFWAMALSMKAFGIGNGPAPDEMVRGFVPELALRLPSMIMGLGSAALLAWVIARLVHWRAGLLAALVLVTMPQYAILTRQAVTDMFFVGPVCLAMAAWAMAWFERERELRTRGRGLLTIPWDRAWLGFFVVFVIAAVVPLAVLHQHVTSPTTHDTVARWARSDSATVESLDLIARHFTIYWVLIVVVLLRSLRWRRRSQAWLGVLYVAGGLSLMGKGMIGPGIIGLLVLVHMLVTGRLHLLWERRCELAIGIVIFVVTCFPWHHAMAIFRGERWVNELIVVNNLARFTTGEQEQAVGGFMFYLRTLGLAALPWSAVAVPAIWMSIAAFRRASTRADASASEVARDASDHPLDPAGELQRLALLWLIASFALISLSVTKYYHYLVPVLPPLAIVIGVWLHALLPRRAGEPDATPGPAHVELPTSAMVVLALGGCTILFLVVEAAKAEPAWIAHLTTYLYTGMWRHGAPTVDELAWCVLPFGLGLVLWLGRLRRASVAALVLSGLLTITFVIDSYLPAASENWSQRTALRHYFDQAKPQDKLLSWWFYYRGETYFSKRRIWVSMEPEREQLAALIDDHRGKHVTFWIMTTAKHAERAPSHLPRDVRDGLEVVYQNFHYALLKVPIP
jgi:4-amino-4-deoxy-L-arabinose transferase-like glycosyltransferase